MIRSVRYLMKWYLCVRNLGERWMREWSCCVSQLKHHRLRECGLNLNTLHLMNLGLLLYSGMHLSLSPSLFWWSLSSLNLGAIGGLLKLYLPQGLLIISVINTGGLEVCLSAQINPDILEYLSKEAVLGEYSGRALITGYHMHHHQIPHVNPSPRQN